MVCFLLFWRFDEAVDRGWWIQGFLACVSPLSLLVWEIANRTFGFGIVFITVYMAHYE